jgi:CxxC motif-containing protein (DUF1111 family)
MITVTHGFFTVCVLALLLKSDSIWALDVILGKALFERQWVAAPASTDAADGLGPLYNARACASCHPRGERGRLQIDADGTVRSPALVVKFTSDSGYGRQLQSQAIPGLPAEGKIRIHYQSQETHLASGKRLVQRKPSYEFTKLAYGPLPVKQTRSFRFAPALHGVGWIEDIPVAAILRLSDPNDRDGDGISGRPRWLTDKPHQTPRLGRYGWKLDAADLEQQTVQALLLDMGLSSPMQTAHAGDCTVQQLTCLRAPHGDSARFDNAELSAEMVRLLVRYLRSLPPPTTTARHHRRAGEQLFQQVGCGTCHHASYRVGEQTIFPYSDFLLHDLGPALGDFLAEGMVVDREWRTAPLWGISRQLLGAADDAALLHDGRARTVEEAILWHGGEGRRVRDRFLTLPADTKARLIQFVEGL